MSLGREFDFRGGALEVVGRHQSLLPHAGKRRNEAIGDSFQSTLTIGSSASAVPLSSTSPMNTTVVFDVGRSETKRCRRPAIMATEKSKSASSPPRAGMP